MTDVHELVVRAKSEGIEEVTEDLEEQQDAFEETADTADAQAGNMETFMEQMQGAMSVVVAALGVATAGLLSRVPIIGQTMELLFGFIEILAFKLDEELRPALTGLNEDLAETQAEAAEAEGFFESLETTVEGVTQAFEDAQVDVLATQLEDLFGIEVPDGFLDIHLGMLFLDPSRVFGGVREQLFSMMDTFSISKGDLAAWVADVLQTFVRWRETLAEIVTDLVEDFIDRLIEWAEWALGIIDGFRVDVREAWEGLKDDAREAGRAIIQRLVDGLRSKLDRLRGIANQIADIIRQRLPSSDAETGPLSDLSQTGPALVDTLAQGMERSAPRAGAAADTVAGSARPTGAAGGGSSGVRIEVPVHLDGREVARIVESHLPDQTLGRGRGRR